MNGHAFYETFKEGLFFLGLTWAKMHRATLSITPEGVKVSYGQKSVIIHLPKGDG